jgi:hypothetical protein
MLSSPLNVSKAPKPPQTNTFRAKESWRSYPCQFVILKLGREIAISQLFRWWCSLKSTGLAQGLRWWETVVMAKAKFTASGSGAEDAHKGSNLKGDPKKLRLRAEELKLHSARLANEADELFAKAEQIEGGRAVPVRKREDVNQAAARTIQEATERA